MRIHKYVGVAVLGIGFGLYESTLLTFLSGWAGCLRPILAGLVFFTLLERRGYALVFAGCAGAVMDLFAVEFPPFAPWRLMLIAAFLGLVSERVLTNRSVYSMVAMVSAARLLDWLWLVSVQWAYGMLGRDVRLAYGYGELGRIWGFDLAMTVALFLVGLLVMRRYLRPRRVLAYG